MTYRIISDLHTEFWGCNGNNEKKLLRHLENSLPSSPQDSENTLILAGDIFSMADFWKVRPILTGLSNRFQEVVWVPGNHEPWGSTYEHAMESYNNEASRLPNVVFGDKFKHGNLVCATLWTDFDRGDPYAILSATHYMLDYQRIIGFTPGTAYRAHMEHLEFIRSNCTEGDVVVTHHAPHPNSIHPRFKGHDANIFYYSDLTETIELCRPKLWIHGHIHNATQYKIGDTTVLCNPHGYKGHEFTNFNKYLTMEI